MKRIICIFIAVAILFSSCKKDGIYHVVICSTSDVHGAYFDQTYDGSSRETSLANVSEYLKQVHSEGYDPVLIDCGDNLQGDLAAYYYNYVNTKPKHLFHQIARYLDYDAIVVGNHDIEAGHSVYDRFKRYRRIPYLAANAVVDDKESEENGNPYFDEYTIVRRNGFKIAIIGMTNANIKSWLSQSQWEGIDFKDISSIAQLVVNKVNKEEKPDVTIMAIHSGTGDEENDLENCGRYLASTLSGVDLILCGHDHTPVAEMVENPNGDIAIINPSSNCQFVGRSDIYFNYQNGEVVGKTVSQTVIPMNTVSVDDDYCKKFQSQFEEVKAFATSEIGTLSEDIDFSDALKGPSSYMSLINKIMKQGDKADIVISAPLTTRGTMKAGVLIYQDLTTLYRYENQMYIVEMSGASIKDYLEYSYDLWINNSSPSYNFDSADGILYKVYAHRPYGSRVEIQSMADGSAFDADKVYSVAMTSYRASGGGGHLKEGAGIDPSELTIIEKFPDIRSLLYDYVKENKTIVPEVVKNWSFVY